MADRSLLAGLLDRASHVFSLAGQLGCIFEEEHSRQRERGLVDPSAWTRFGPAFNGFCAAVLELRDSMQNPPDGFAPVAGRLLEVARIAKQIREAMQRPGGPDWAMYLDFWPYLTSAAGMGRQAIVQVTKTLRLDDPFGFLDAPTTPMANGIDTTPTSPKPPAARVVAAERHIPHVLSNVRPVGGGPIELMPVTLIAQLQNAGHTFAASHWAIHEAVQAGRLLAGPIDVELPSVGVSSTSWGRPAYQWHGGGRGTKAIPKGKPTPLDCFKVTATDALWEWWRSLDRPETGDDTSRAEMAEHLGAAQMTPSDASHSPNLPTIPVRKNKRSSERGEGRAKLIPALTKHHRYAEGGCLNEEPAKNNELARMAGVDRATASYFFKKEFGGHAKYKRLCQNASLLVAALKQLNGEFTPRELLREHLSDEVV